MFLPAFWRRKKKNKISTWTLLAHLPFRKDNFWFVEVLRFLGQHFWSSGLFWAFSSLLELFPASVGLRASFGIFLGSTFSWPEPFWASGPLLNFLGLASSGLVLGLLQGLRSKSPQKAQKRPEALEKAPRPRTSWEEARKPA